MSNSPSCKPSTDRESQAKAQAIKLAQDFCVEFSDLDRPARLRVVTAFRGALIRPRPRGRKPDPRITAAFQDWINGMHGVAFYRKHIPGYDQMGEWRRRGESRRLMEAIRSRRRHSFDEKSADRR